LDQRWDQDGPKGPILVDDDDDDDDDYYYYYYVRKYSSAVLIPHRTLDTFLHYYTNSSLPSEEAMKHIKERFEYFSEGEVNCNKDTSLLKLVP
jgi:hypothetical protein